MFQVDYEAMAHRIKAQRKYMSLTQEQVSEIIGISYSSYVKIENAFQHPSLTTLARISQTLNISLDKLIFGA